MNNDPNSEPEDKDKAGLTQEEQPLQCTCVQDPFLSLPPELRPRPRNTMGSLVKVTCPGCGLVYWTNRKTDFCAECEKKGLGLPQGGT